MDNLVIQISLSEHCQETTEEYIHFLGKISSIINNSRLNVLKVSLVNIYNSFNPRKVDAQFIQLEEVNNGEASFNRQDLFDVLNEIYSIMPKDGSAIGGWFIHGETYYKVDMSYEDDDNIYPYVDESIDDDYLCGLLFQ